MAKEMLELKTRRKIYEIIDRYPGLHFREIQRRANMSHGTLKYHLDYMVKRRLVAVVDDGGLKRYYAHGKVDRRDKIVLSVLRKDIERAIIIFLLMNKGATFQQIRAHLGISQSKLSYHIKKLVDKAIVAQKKAGRSTFYYVSDEERVARILITYRPTFLDALVDAFVKAWLGK